MVILARTLTSIAAHPSAWHNCPIHNTGWGRTVLPCGEMSDYFIAEPGRQWPQENVILGSIFGSQVQGQACSQNCSLAEELCNMR